MKKNQKGFTLVELLAVIVILAVLILIAVTAVLPQMEKSRKNAFADEVLAFAKAGREAYTTTAMTDPDKTCFTLTELKGEYITKNDDSYTGYVIVTPEDSSVEAHITNGKYYYEGDTKTTPSVTKGAKTIASTCPAAEGE